MRSVSCIICGGNDAAVLYPATIHADAPLNAEGFRCTAGDYRSHQRIVRCAQCGHVYASPRWTEKELLAAYTDVEDHTYVTEEEGRARTFRARSRELQRITGPANGRSLLDVGAYTGMFVREAISMGWDAKGIELSKWCADIAKSRGLPVVQQTLEQAASEVALFDVITLWDVIEHIDDPVKEIRNVRRMLRHGGIVVIHTMDIGSLCAKAMRGRWPWFLGMHLHFFSKKSLSKLLEREGFKVLDASASGRTLLLGYFAERLADLFPFPGKIFRRIVQILSMERVPIRLNFGDLMTVYAKKTGTIASA